jgi:hypothetical protein
MQNTQTNTNSKQNIMQNNTIMKTNATFSEQLITIGKYLEQNKTCEGHIYTGDIEDPGYFDLLLQYGDPNLLNRTDIQILDIHQETTQGNDSVWGFAFKIDTENGTGFYQTVEEIRELLDDDSIDMEYKTLWEVHLAIFSLEC